MTGARGQTFNVGADTPYSVLALAREVGEVFGVQPDINHLPARNEVQHAYSDHSRIRATFGTQTMTPLREGLERMANWARSIGVRPSRATNEIEVTEGLPSSWRPQ